MARSGLPVALGAARRTDSPDPDLDRFDRLQAAVRQGPACPAGVRELEAASALSSAELAALTLRHAHLPPAAWLERTRVARAAQRLLLGAKVSEGLAQEAGFGDLAALDRGFLRWRGVAASGYARTDAAGGFALRRPPGYRPDEVLAYHGRDPQSRTERRDGNRLWKALATAAGPVVLETEILPRAVRARIHADDRRLPPAVIADVQQTAVAMLGLDQEVKAFETAHPGLVGPRAGLRVAGLATPFEALVWAIIGQQIHLGLATALRRDVIGLAGVPVGAMRTHPPAEAIAALSPAGLATRRFSRAKASYLVDAAQAVAAGALPLDALMQGSAVAAERALVARRGIGPWTARYVLLRCGYADAAPAGDSALATALARVLALSPRPDAVRCGREMTRYAPHRSLATAHLWASLREPATAVARRTKRTG